VLRSKQKACASNAVLVIVFASVEKKKFNHASNVGDGVMKVSLVMKGLHIKTSA
jgi:hypothetical protein